MASSAFKTAIKDELQCPICLEYFTEPKTLASCGHTLCRECLEKIANTSIQKGKRFILCPVCRSITQITAGGVADIPTNTTLMSIVRLTQAAEGKAEIDKSVVQARGIVRELTDISDAVDGMMSRLELRQEQVKRAINAKAKEQISEIKKQVKDLTQLADGIIIRKRSDLASVKDNVKLRVKSTAHAIREAEILLERGNCDEIIDKKKELITKLTEIDKHYISKPDTSDTILQFVPTDDKARMPKLGVLTQTTRKSSTDEPQLHQVNKLNRCSGYCRVTESTRVQFGKPGSYPGHFKCPHGLDINECGEFAVADSENHRIQIFTWENIHNFSRKDKPFVGRVLGKHGRKLGEFNFPTSVAFTRNDEIAVMDHANNRVQILDKRGRVVNAFGKAGTKPGEFKGAYGLSVDETNRIIIADTGNNRVQVFERHGGRSYTMSMAFGQQHGMEPMKALFKDQTFFVSDRGDKPSVRIFDNQGILMNSFLTEGLAVDGYSGFPKGLALDSRHNIIVCLGTDLVIFEPNGNLLKYFRVMIDDKCHGAWDVAIHGDHLYIADVVSDHLYKHNYEFCAH